MLYVQPYDLPGFYAPWPARLNPNVERARRHTKTWARDMDVLVRPSGLGTSSRIAELVGALGSALVSGW